MPFSRVGAMHKQDGFTLVEMMFTLGMSAALVGMAVPAYRGFVQNSHLTGLTNTLVADLSLARSEAVKRSADVVLCRSADPSAAPPTCGGTAQTWSSGWLVFVDVNGDGAYLPADNDVLIRRGQPSPDNVTLRSNAVADAAFGYLADGTSDTSGNTARFALCDDRGASAGRQLNIGPVGRIDLVTGTSTAPLGNCTNPV